MTPPTMSNHSVIQTTIPVSPGVSMKNDTSGQRLAAVMVIILTNNIHGICLMKAPLQRSDVIIFTRYDKGFFSLVTAGCQRAKVAAVETSQQQLMLTVIPQYIQLSIKAKLHVFSTSIPASKQKITELSVILWQYSEPAKHWWSPPSPLIWVMIYSYSLYLNYCLLQMSKNQD